MKLKIAFLNYDKIKISFPDWEEQGEEEGMRTKRGMRERESMGARHSVLTTQISHLWPFSFKK